MTHFAVVDPTMPRISYNGNNFTHSIGINIETIEEVLWTGRLSIEYREWVIQYWVVLAEMPPDIKHPKPSSRDFFSFLLR